MKQKFSIILTAIALICGILPATAEYRSVTVNLRDHSTVTVNLASDLAVRFNDLEMTITGSTVPQTIVIEKNLISSFEHSTLASITDAATDPSTPTITDGEIHWTGLPAGTGVEVIDNAGRIVKAVKAKGDFTLSLTSLTPGIYIVRTGTSTIKVAVK